MVTPIRHPPSGHLPETDDPPVPFGDASIVHASNISGMPAAHVQTANRPTERGRSAGVKNPTRTALPGAVGGPTSTDPPSRI